VFSDGADDFHEMLQVFIRLLKIKSGSQKCNQFFSHQQVPFPIRVKAVLQKIFFKNTSGFV
jgi:hypothetical protein